MSEITMTFRENCAEPAMTPSPCGKTDIVMLEHIQLPITEPEVRPVGDDAVENLGAGESPLTRKVLEMSGAP